MTTAASLRLKGVGGGEGVVLGVGACCVDYIATVKSYPEPDAKIRSESLSVMGGGNCANSLTALARLGVKCRMLTKLGDDGTADVIMGELESEGIDVTRIVRYEGPSPFTYIIVDQKAQTRTCIHTPAKEDLVPEEIDPEGIFDGVDFLHLDGRMTLAAIKVAKLANVAGIPVLLDVEKDRPHLRELLPLADYIVTNSDFPSRFTGSESQEEGMKAIMGAGRAKTIISTLGSLGCAILHRGQDRIQRYPAYEIDERDIIDTTGAGDGFIGGCIYGLMTGLSERDLIELASYVASQKLRAPGARTGLPSLAKARESLHFL